MIVVFIIYLLVVVGIAIWSARKSKSNKDFVLGGKKIGGFALALSERSTGESAWLLLGLTGEAYAIGLGAIWVALGCVIGICFIWIFMSGRLRREADRTGALTIPSLLSKKFPGTEKSIGIISAVIIIFFFLFYIAAQFSGAGKVFYETFKIDPFWGMVIGSFVVTLYTMFGGFIAVVATDVFQAVLMIFTLIVLPILLLTIAASHNIDLAQNISHASGSFYSLTEGKTGWFGSLVILNGLSWAFGYTGQPQLLARMMALKNERDTKIATWVALIWTLLAYAGAIAIGIVGYILIKNGMIGNEASKVAEDMEHVLPSLVVTLLNPILAGILLSGVVSAMMSTASSELILCSTSITEDLYIGTARKKMREKKLLLLNKLLTLAVGVIAFVMVLLMKETVYALVSYAWAGIGSSFGPALFLLLFWKRLSRAGVFASLISGTVCAILWKHYLMDVTGISERLGSFVFAFLMAVLFSLIIPEKKNATNELSL
jgi:sodium/proline symporter